MRPVVLVVDDDPGVLYTLKEILETTDMEVHEATDGLEALAWLGDHRADLMIADLRMPRLDGLGLLRRLSEVVDPPRTIMITAHGSERHAVEAIKLGAHDYFSKPFDMDQILQVVERAVASVRMSQENEQLRAALHLSRHMIFASEAMGRVALMVYRVAPKDVTVLVTGESGTGKERLCEALVDGSRRRQGPFVRFNCAALPRDLAEAELFGHAKGAFTGAVRSRLGLFREAHGGTLLLDEVSELDPATQGKLLRVLQEGRVRPVGESRDVEVDVRILAATNRSLRADGAAGRFREDLYYRLNVVEIRLPSLAERPEDIPLLIDHFLRVFAERFGEGPLHLPAALRARLVQGAYPGNVRELQHAVERLVALSAGGVVDGLGLAEGGEVVEFGLKAQVEAYERGLIAAELQRCGGNRSETARRLGIGRVTLLDKMKKYGLG